MAGEGELRAKVEELFRRAGSAGERAAAGAAMERLRGRLGGELVEEAEVRLSLPDVWSVRLFVAVCRKHGVRPFRYRRQRRTTVMVRVGQGLLERVLWPEFERLHRELESYFEDVTDHLIEDALGSDGEDGGLGQR